VLLPEQLFVILAKIRIVELTTMVVEAILLAVEHTQTAMGMGLAARLVEL
jgi:hypothetical protein